MSLPQWLGRLVGLDSVTSIDSAKTSLAAPWAQHGPAWVFFACLAAVAVSVLVYLRYQPGKHVKGRMALAAVRALLLSLLVVMLADPILTLKLTSSPRPQLWFVFDGTESMGMQDKLPDAERTRLHAAVELSNESSAGSTPVIPSRMQYVRSWIEKKDGALLKKLGEKYRLRAFIFDGPDDVRSLDWQTETSRDGRPGAFDAAKLTTKGQVTAIGKAFEDLAQRRATTFPAGVVMISDFDHNSGPDPVSAAKRLGVPIYTIGVGPTAAIDLAIDLQSPPVMKKGERSTVSVTLRQTGFEGQKVRVSITSRRLGDTEDAVPAASSLVAQRDVELKGQAMTFDVPFTPEQTGRFEFLAEVPVLDGEVVEQNNRAVREVQIRDDFLRLLYVEYEPTWEWRFIKEVFHRDPLVGERGFRTFLRSSDPKVRNAQGLFLPTLTPSRSDFFANDVLFLGDVKAEMLTQGFGDRVKEFVGKFGGGLVIVSGPRFGPTQLANTPLAEMLPVVVEADKRRQDRGDSFQPRLTAAAGLYDFMQLGNDAAENRKAWDNLGSLSWYQPSSRVHPLATVLSEHPTDKCDDGKTPQPLIAVRRYGRGEVVYLAYDEMWRLRRRHGETYYRQFWGQMIHRLGLSHALGTQKRFVVRTDQPHYQVEDKVTVTVEAYDADFKPLADDKLADRRLTGQLLAPTRPGEKAEPQPIVLNQLREGIFETRLPPVIQGGQHTVLVKDPVTGEMANVSFQVRNVSLEQRSAVRNSALQQEIAQVSGGIACDLVTADRMLEELHLESAAETSIKVISLWDTWLVFALVVALLVGEWLFRKMINLQ